jgi:hypothetical protein
LARVASIRTTKFGGETEVSYAKDSICAEKHIAWLEILCNPSIGVIILFQTLKKRTIKQPAQKRPLVLHRHRVEYTYTVQNPAIMKVLQPLEHHNEKALDVTCRKNTPLIEDNFLQE